MIIRFDLNCPFPACVIVLGEAFAESSRQQSLLLAHICTFPCSGKKRFIDAELLLGRSRAEIKVNAAAFPDTPERPTSADVDFVLDSYPLPS